MKKLILLLFVIFTLSAQAKRVELVFWHGMAGHLGDEVRLLADDFNQSQNEYFIKPVYKGNYVETLTSFAAAFRAHHPPAIVQIFEVGTAIMESPKGVIKPVDELMQEQGISLPKEDFIQSVREFYSKNDQLMALPFNLSVATLYYNLDILAKVGYSQANFPRTWAEMEVLAEKLKAAGYDCTYTTAYPGWVLFESFLAIHGLPLTQDNPARAVFDTPQLLSHFERLKRWYTLHYFRYAGRVDDATILFTSGVCPLFSQSSGAYNSLAALVPFRLGIASMPLDTKASKIRHANVAGGAALWAVAGQTKEQYKGIAQFFAFITRPETQKRWHEHTGYLPIGLQGVYADILRNSHHPTLLMARIDLAGELQEKPLPRFGPQNQIRGINDEILEAMFAGFLTPNEALRESTVRTNHVLSRFVRNTTGSK
ncbi:glycerol-3-phosphate-binding periplasmic protein precursor [Legionella steigerwaltii]|uniref:sn-glycerol-3-phosphate-binding periplasmic protein UgpB n=1 Tax=Legionella steigerwaltii TaxID=460 RepID=A0A378LB31_9GAMM|nr:extracellular solute-binding protein [Legionella steigerwaltii]KTD71927.1 glycerol-3-phosphate-binding periplasmic protein precursor [Legionella steigerwaltii]STY23924.1 glycerol-3-phosphate-binding periplasmic protein precursor [Legionella steigerwaltii]